MELIVAPILISFQQSSHLQSQGVLTPENDAGVLPSQLRPLGVRVLKNIEKNPPYRCKQDKIPTLKGAKL